MSGSRGAGKMYWLCLAMLRVGGGGLQKIQETCRQACYHQGGGGCCEVVLWSKF